jgi:AcrR family transcriptional regulator
MELYLERGFEQTTVAEIAERAGVTARTFFRYFPDKREVLFGGWASLQAELVAALESAPKSATPMTAVGAALDVVAAELGGNREFSQQRQKVIVANAELRERELTKMASLSIALADGLRRRGVKDPDAGLAAEAGVAVFRVAFDRWITEPTAQDFPTVMRDSLNQLRILAAG